MKILDYCLDNRPQTDTFVPRKSILPEEANINLYGVRGSGKTAIVLDSIEALKNESTLYIDMKHPHFLFHLIESVDLQKYIIDKKITLLVLDHYKEDLLPCFPKVESMIVITRIPLVTSAFVSMELFPLDYEEFLAFESSSSLNKGFNHFLRSGTLPAIAPQQSNTAQHLQRFFYSYFDTQEQKLLLLLAEHHGKHLTTNQIYLFAKEKFKISKDWLYKTMTRFTQEKLLHFIEDKHQKSGKKMLLFDFAFAKYLSLGQPFGVQFDSMIALTLIKHGIPIQTLGIHGYLSQENELIIPSSFESEESLWVKSQKKFSLYKQYDIKKVTIVTISNHYEFDIEKIHFEALPFDEWSVSHSEI